MWLCKSAILTTVKASVEMWKCFMPANTLLSVMQVIHEDFIVTEMLVFLSAFNMKVHFLVHRRMTLGHILRQVEPLLLRAVLKPMRCMNSEL
jgi:hypothetical protein